MLDYPLSFVLSPNKLENMRKLLLFGTTAILALSLSSIMTGCKEDKPSPPPPPPTEEGVPLVFHILYESDLDLTQNPPTTLIDLRVKQLNDFYAAKMAGQESSTPINVKFTRALYGPDGKPLAEPGIHRVQYSSATSLDPDKFMKSTHNAGSPNSAIFWDPNKYVNIWLFGFSTEGVTGISYIAYATSKDPIRGLNNGDYFLSNQPPYMHGISLSNKYFETNEEGLQTLAHEVGHYLGLFHAFEAEKGCDDPADASDDWCTDTPKYDRKQYDALVETFLPPSESVTANSLNTHDMYYKHGSMLAVESTGTVRRSAGSVASPQFDSKITLPVELLFRTSCAGVTFASTNIMDYYFGTCMRFTPEQRDRVEYVLKYSPLIPRPKAKSTHVIEQNNAEIPVARIMK